jgi:serine/threonine-protein kinase
VRAKLLRILGFCAYGGLLIGVFGLASYFSFSLFVRSGVTRTPDLSGLPQDQAIQTLNNLGLAWSFDDKGRYSDMIPAGQVVQQRPAPGTLVKRGSLVQAVASLGPERVAVPDLSDHALPSAQVTLAAAGLTLGRTLSVRAEHGAPGTVVDQRPAAGTEVSPSQPIDLFVAATNTADAYLMPDLVYRDYERVRRLFESAGFRIGSVRFEPYAEIPAGVILRQFPLPGHPVSRRDALSLVIAAPAGE